MKPAVFTAWAILAWTLVGPQAWAQAPSVAPSAGPEDVSSVPEDPRIRRGVLPGGLRYAVMSLGRPKGGVSIRLAIDVGSYEETDQQRGIAHFIEHMAFRSTRAFPDNSVDGLFTSQGVKFGRDLNAETSLFSTVYKIDLPSANDAALSLGLKWLRGVADGVVFDSDSLERERGVVLAEKEARDSSDAAAQTALMQFEAPSSRSTAREPIGLEKVLQTATPSTLREFYDHWYRPDSAIVVAVGDLPVDALEARIRAAFGSWQSIGPAPVKAPRNPPAEARGLDTISIARPALLETVRACRHGSSEPVTTGSVATIRRQALEQIWAQILNLRLAALRYDPANTMIGARVETEDNGGDLRTVCLVAYPTPNGSLQALRATELELRRFQDLGPTDMEVEDAVESVRSGLRSERTNGPNRASSEIADDIVQAVLEGGVVIEPQQRLRAFDIAMESISAAEVRASFAHDWAGPGPFVSAISASPPSAEALRSTWLAGQNAPAAGPIVDREAAVWAYNFGAPGTVASRRIVKPGDFVRIVFRNGVTLNVKQTSFEKDNLHLALRFGAGRQEIAGKDFFPAVMGATMFALGGSGKYSFDDIKRMFQSSPQNFNIVLGEKAFQIDGAVTSRGLDDQLEVLAAYMSDPGFRPSLDPILKTGIEVSYRLAETSPQIKAGTALDQAVAPGSPLTLPPKSVLGGVSAASLANILRPSITRDPVEITLVGDIDEKTAISEVAATFGALPPRTSPVPRRTDTAYVRFPEAPPQLIRAVHQGPPDKALAEAIWPLYVGAPGRRREDYAIDLLAAIFSDELLQRVRIELGKSYAPGAAARISDGADQGQLIASVESHPEDIELMLTQIRAVAGKLRDGEISQAQLDAARTPMIARVRQSMNTNARWAEGIAGSSLDDQNLRDVLSFGDALQTIGLEDVRKAAKDWLSRDPWTVIVEPQSVKGGKAP